MTEKDLKPLPTGCIKNISDKLFEKRKAGVLEAEQIVKSLAIKEKFSDIEHILTIFSEDFILSCNCHMRKGGLMGMASVAIGLGPNASNYAKSLLIPILKTFRDYDMHVRYVACESLYNILKMLQTAALNYLNDIFEALSVTNADPDASVRQVAMHCDRLLRDVIIQSASINLDTFVPLLCERIYTTSPFSRQFLLCWITTLNSIPSLCILDYLPEFLDGLFRILGDSNSAIRRNCELLLSDFLKETIKKPNADNLLSMVNTLIVNCRLSTAAVSEKMVADRTEIIDCAIDNHVNLNSPERLQQVTALNWIQTFVEYDVLSIIHFVSDIIGAILPCIFDENADTDAIAMAVRINEKLMTTVYNMKLQESPQKDHSSNTDSSQTDSLSETDPVTNYINCKSILRVVFAMFDHVSVLTRLAALRWIEVLIEVRPKDVFSYSTILLPLLLKLLSDPTTEVVRSTISLIGCLCNHPSADCYTHEPIQVMGDTNANKNGLSDLVKCTIERPVVKVNTICLRFLLDLVNLFISNNDMLHLKGDLIISDLCVVLGAKAVYYVMAVIVSNSLQPKDAFLLVHTLNRILLTQPSLGEFRNFLRNLHTKDDAQFFEQMYQTWCHNPVALLSFCLLTQHYSHCRNLIKSFGELAVSIEVLVEMDQLIQMIESPVFATLRLHLIDKRHSAALQETLYCLLMCLPQTGAFETLRRRLQCLPSYALLDNENKLCKNEKKKNESGYINFDALLQHFHIVQKLHFDWRLKNALIECNETASDRVKSGTETSSAAKSTRPTTILPNESRSEIDNALKSHQLNLFRLPNGEEMKGSSTLFLIQELEKLGISILD